jgi:endonuclease/exonuclease/phosphatase family metal-dependent hydrolase
MKILTLNTWGGRAGKEKLLNFLKEQSTNVDIFCLQEIWAAPYSHLEGVNAGGLELKNADTMVYGKQDIANLLTDYDYFFHPHHGDHYGLMMLVKQGIDVLGSGDMFVHKDRGHIPEGDVGNHARNIQYVTFSKDDVKTTVINFHGLWNGKGKTDSPDRIEQSKKIVEFTQNLEGNIVLCGDFNLLPDTESITILEQAGLRNLVKESGITSTRTSYYTKPEKYADYMFVSKGVTVKDFRVLPDEVSDHSPLLLVIE